MYIDQYGTIEGRQEASEYTSSLTKLSTSKDIPMNPHSTTNEDIMSWKYGESVLHSAADCLLRPFQCMRGKSTPLWKHNNINLPSTLNMVIVVAEYDTSNDTSHRYNPE